MERGTLAGFEDRLDVLLDDLLEEPDRGSLRLLVYLGSMYRSSYLAVS